MATDFSQLLDALRSLKDRHGIGDDPAFSKALPPAAPAPATLPALTAKRLKELNASLDTMAKAFGVPTAGAVRRRAKARDAFAKSFSSLNAKLGVAVQAGKVSAHEAAIVEARMHRLSQVAQARLAGGK